MKLINILSEVGSNKCEELFGKYLFGEYQQFYNSVKEKNTDFEQQTFDQFISWIERSDGKRAITTKYAIELLKCKNQFPKVLNPNQTVYYRAFAFMSDSEIFHNIKTVEDELVYGDNRNWYNDKLVDAYLSYVNRTEYYQPLSLIESWTNSKNSAIKFAKQVKHISTQLIKRNSRQATCILKYTGDDTEMLFNPKFMSKLSSDIGYGQQNEILRVSANKQPIKVQISYIPLLPEFGHFRDLNIPKDRHEYVKNQILNKWKSF